MLEENCVDTLMFKFLTNLIFASESLYGIGSLSIQLES